MRLVRSSRASLTSSMLVMAILNLATGALATDAGFSIEPDVVYGRKLGMALTFDVFRPGADANGAGVLFMVSGGWFSRWAPPEQAVERFRPLLDAGFTVFAVRHGSAPLFKVPDAVADVREAVHFIRSNAARFGVDPDRLGAWGGSAGGHLSLMLGTTAVTSAAVAAGEETVAAAPPATTPDRLAAVVAYFPPVDLRGITGPNERFPALDFAPESAPEVSPVLHVSADDSPTLLIHGDQDTLVPLSNSERMIKAFKEHGVTSDLVVLAGAEHGFRGEHAERALQAAVAWFKAYLLTPQAVAATGE